MNLEAILLKVAEKAFEHLFLKGADPIGLQKATSPVEINLSNYITQVKNWCSSTHVFMEGSGISTQAQTISLSLMNAPRRFRGTDGTAGFIEENALVESPKHYLVLGDPGSGKTTTLKRIAYRLLTTPPANEQCDIQFPLAIICRDFDYEVGLVENLCRNLQIPILSADTDIQPLDKKRRRDLAKWISPALMNIRPLLIIDGLDEVPTSYLERLLDDIQFLASCIENIKIVTTCRSGEYRRPLQGFDIVEISPLSFKEIQAISEIWFEDPKKFYQAIDGLPYVDITDRPLLIIQLIFLYKRQGYLPEQPSQVSHHVLQLLLKQWDEERGIVRNSAYADFNADRKERFLAEFAFVLTVEVKGKIFSHDDFLEAYAQVRESFGLAESQAEDIVREIESHTGIVVRSGFARFEFCHLSLQEYLVANYLVRCPLNEKAGRYFREYPGPMAVAVALSSDPAAWLMNVAQHCSIDDMFKKNWAVSGFFRRLTLERPVFKASKKLGHTLLALFFATDVVDSSRWHDAKKISGLETSICEALSDFVVEGQIDKGRGYQLDLYEVVEGGEFGETGLVADLLTVESRLLRKIVRENRLGMSARSNQGDLLPFRGKNGKFAL